MLKHLLLFSFALAACAGEYVIGDQQRLIADPCAGACTADQECVVDTTDACHQGGATDCPGVCRAKPPAARLCGGNSLLTCAADETCVVDLQDACHTGGATDCPGTCQPKQAKPCGGNSLFTCDPGQTCVVDPADACHTSGATDCPGTCR